MSFELQTENNYVCVNTVYISLSAPLHDITVMVLVQQYLLYNHQNMSIKVNSYILVKKHKLFLVL
jgi:hypothetical protein